MTAPRGFARALRSRNYRLFVSGQGVSLIGTWMQQVAMSWLVYRLTGSALLLGVLGFAHQIPSLILTPVAGVLADHWDRRRLLIATQTFAMLQAALLAVVVLLKVVQVWQVVLLSVVLGVVNAFDIPIRQSFVVEMVENREDLGNAIALNASLFNSARLIGPSLAGFVVSTVGEGICFLLNSMSFLGVIVALVAMRFPPQGARPPRRHVLQELHEGLRYAFGFGPFRSILLLVALTSLMGTSYSVLMPVFARDVLHGGARTFGLLMTAAGAGALASTLYLASRRSVLGLGRVISSSVSLMSVGIAIFAFSGSLFLSMAALALVGFGVTAAMASCNTIIQTIVQEDKRGRVMSLYAVSFNGVAPFGSLLAGALAARFGPSPTLLVGSVCCLTGALLFAKHLPNLREKVRPIYLEKGILGGNIAVAAVDAEQ